MNPVDLQPRMFLIIPVFNEAGNIERLLAGLDVFARTMADRYRLEVLLVDDGSRDETADLAKRTSVGFPLTVLCHPGNLGPGRAFGTGFREVASRFNDRDIVLTMEGDNTSRLELVPKMLHRMDEGYDVILASPYIYGGDIVHTSALRIFLSNMANVFVKDLLGIHGIFTVSSFYRMYSVPMLRQLQAAYGPEIMEQRGFECMTEMLMKMIQLGARISEIAMVLDTKLRVGKSRMKITRTIVGYHMLWKNQAKWKRMAEELQTARATPDRLPSMDVKPVERG